RRVTAPNWHGAGVLVPVGACESGWLPLAGAPATLCAGPPMRGAGGARSGIGRPRADCIVAEHLAGFKQRRSRIGAVRRGEGRFRSTVSRAGSRIRTDLCDAL